MLLSLSRALLAESVKNDLVVGHLESGGNQLPESLDTFLKVKYLLALATVEMVMVTFFRSFVAWRLAGYLNTADLSVLDEGFDGTVNGGDADSGHQFQGKLMDFLGKQGTILLLEDCLDGLFLSGGATLG